MAEQIATTRDVAAKVLATVDAGLVSGVGEPIPGQMCVEAAVNYALGLPHGDNPPCVSRALRALKIRLNDSAWSSDDARAKGLRRLALAQLGSRGTLNDREFVRHLAKLAIRKWTPFALRAAASVHPDHKHKAVLLDAAARCEKEGTLAAASAAYAAANDAASAAYAAAAADDDDAAYAASAAANDAAYASAASAAADDDDDAAYAASASASASAAANAASAAAKAARDKALAEFSEDVVQVLIEMGAPGCEWLDMAPLQQAA